MSKINQAELTLKLLKDPELIKFEPHEGWEWECVDPASWIVLLRQYPHLTDFVDWTRFTKEHWIVLEEQVPKLKEFIDNNKDNYLMMNEVDNDN